MNQPSYGFIVHAQHSGNFTRVHQGFNKANRVLCWRMVVDNSLSEVVGHRTPPSLHLANGRAESAKPREWVAFDAPTSTTPAASAALTTGRAFGRFRSCLENFRMWGAQFDPCVNCHDSCAHDKEWAGQDPLSRKTNYLRAIWPGSTNKCTNTLASR